MRKVTFENKNETRIVEVAAWLEEKGQQEDFRLGTAQGYPLNEKLTPLDNSVGILSKDYHVVPGWNKTRREFIGGLFLSYYNFPATKWMFFMNNEKNIPFVEKLMGELADYFNVDIIIKIKERGVEYETYASDYSSID